MASCLPLFILFLLTIFVKLFLFFILTPSFYILAQLLQAFKSYQEDPTIHVAIKGQLLQASKGHTICGAI
jgi:hypothetical protein